ncbi:hypothetical protein A8926_6369 [Saccharopolyspora spinosa]|uniref:Uncharacterized protein n=1 Tax=Saccharopolyspora spinosa TaxID=60894 RepID=A0A2N3Y5V9_SACSN|nr:hypothetical protein A8926_6369 [Saccharopolyspora spinosa]
MKRNLNAVPPEYDPNGVRTNVRWFLRGGSDWWFFDACVGIGAFRARSTFGASWHAASWCCEDEALVVGGEVFA